MPLDALGPWPEPLASSPVLVWEAEGNGARRVCSLNRAAQALGVEPGQRLATAQALAPDALVVARDPAREAQLLERLALTLGELTPQIVLAPPDQVLLDIHASLRLFGGLRALLRRARALVRRQRVHSRWGLAATALAAQWLAAQPALPLRPSRRSPHRPRPHRRCVRPNRTLRLLHGLPVTLAAARLPALAGSGLEMLQSLGVHTLADLHRLPRSGLTRRGGAAWLDALDRAEGLKPDPRPLYTPPSSCRLTLDLPHPAETVERIEAALTPLVEALCGWLALRWRAATGLELHLRHEQGARRHRPDRVLTLALASPTRSAEHLLTLLRERLQRLELTAAVDALTLTLTGHQPEAGQALALLPDTPDLQTLADAQAALIDRLRARLGEAKVCRIRLQHDARPERAERRDRPDIDTGRHTGQRTGSTKAAAQSSPGGSAPTAPISASTTPSTPTALPTALPAAAPAPRPSWLLPDPLPLALRGEVPVLAGRPLRLLTRAERIETGWHDNLLLRRDYHVAIDDEGRLWWLFRDFSRQPDEGRTAADGAPDDAIEMHQACQEPAPPRWFLHGLFG